MLLKISKLLALLLPAELTSHRNHQYSRKDNDLHKAEEGQRESPVHYRIKQEQKMGREKSKGSSEWKGSPQYSNNPSNE